MGDKQTDLQSQWVYWHQLTAPYSTAAPSLCKHAKLDLVWSKLYCTAGLTAEWEAPGVLPHPSLLYSLILRLDSICLKPGKAKCQFRSSSAASGLFYVSCSFGVYRQNGLRRTTCREPGRCTQTHTDTYRETVRHMRKLHIWFGHRTPKDKYQLQEMWDNSGGRSMWNHVQA